MCLIASPPRFVSVEELMETAQGVTNMALAHEILVNQAFQVKPAEVPEGRSVFSFEAVAWLGFCCFVFLAAEVKGSLVPHKTVWRTG